jgi:hypothetical protein
VARYLRWTYFGWFAVVTALIVLQLYLAGYGVFAFNGLNGFGAHFLVGDLIGIAIILGIGLAFAARVPRRLLAMNGGLVVLMIIQFVLAHTGIAIISALHVLNGILILGGTANLTREAWKLRPRPEAAPA